MTEQTGPLAARRAAARQTAREARMSDSELRATMHPGDHPHVFHNGVCTCGFVDEDAVQRAADYPVRRGISEASGAEHPDQCAHVWEVDLYGRITCAVCGGDKPKVRVTARERRVLTRSNCDHRPDNLPCRACGLGMTRDEQIALQMTRQTGAESESA